MPARKSHSQIRPSGLTHVFALVAAAAQIVRAGLAWLGDVLGTVLAMIGVTASVGFGSAKGYILWREQTATGARDVSFVERAGLLWHYARWVHRIRRTR